MAKLVKIVILSVCFAVMAFQVVNSQYFDGKILPVANASSDKDCGDMVKLYKASNYRQICVSEATSQVLIERGYAVSTRDDMKHDDKRSDYKMRNEERDDKMMNKTIDDKVMNKTVDTTSPSSEGLAGQKTTQVTDETFLSKTVQEWKEVNFNKLIDYNEKYDAGLDFFDDLGAFLVKNEMLLQLEKENITNANDDFDVYAGIALLSLPPHIHFQSVVNGTDDNSYHLKGVTFGNSVRDVTITQLAFYDVDEKLSIDSILSQNQVIQILPKDDNGPRVEPYALVIDSNRNSIVDFENKQAMPIQILGGND